MAVCLHMQSSDNDLSVLYNVFEAQTFVRLILEYPSMCLALQRLCNVNRHEKMIIKVSK
jgi:hypothetical protein